MASKELFIIRVRNFASEKPPDSGDEALMAQYLLPKIVPLGKYRRIKCSLYHAKAYDMCYKRTCN